MKIQFPAKILVLFALVFAVVGCGSRSSVNQGAPTTSASNTVASSVGSIGATPKVVSTLPKSDLTATPVPTMRVESATKVPSQTVLPPTPRLIFASPGKSPLDWAQLMIQNVRLSNTSYQHKDDVVTWAGVNGAIDYASHADCSGFVNALITQAYGLGSGDYAEWLGSRRPLAKDYFSAIENKHGFQSVANIANIQLGDLIVVRYLNSAPGDNTGHILLVTALPQRRTAINPVVNNTQQWDVVIIDSSESGHGKDDTRLLPDGSYQDGVGRGTMRLYADNNGALVGYAWSDLTESLFYDATARPLVIGRIDPKFSLPF